MGEEVLIIITWTSSTTSVQFYVQFETGSEGNGRILEVTNLDFKHFIDSSPFTVLPCASVVSITATPGLTVLTGSSLTLTASRGTNYPVDRYTWSTGETPSFITVSNVTSTTAFTVTAITGSCSGTASAAVSVTQIPPVSLTLSASPTVVCAGIASATVIADCGELIQAKANSLIVSSVLGPDNCAVSLQGSGYGTGYTVTGPGGYVFSAVYRKLGYYSLNAPNITKPGTYTLTVSYSDACERITTETITYVVNGEACK